MPQLPAQARATIEANVKTLGDEITALAGDLKDKPALLALLPDVQIYHNALRYPLQYNETIDLKLAAAAFKNGMDRAAQLRAGDVRWTQQPGPRGYVSRIDGSVQPYLVVTPRDFDPKAQKAYRLDFFCHGRGEDLTELKFISGKSAGDAPTNPPDANRFVVFPYGRFCNANKFAGEIDLLEVLDDMKRRHTIDENRIVMTGFSMGGAAAWQFAVHYTDLFAAASPGAGFSESREFLKIPQAEVDATAPWRRALWHLYDCTDYVANLSMLPTVAYAGEIDGQKQASDVMLREAAKEGVAIERLIGPKTAHKYEPEGKKQIAARIDEICAKGRNPVPAKVRFTTWTLRYNRMFWVSVDGLERHWERARVEADIKAPDAIEVKTTNVTSLVFDIPAAGSPLSANAKVAVTIDGQTSAATTNDAKGLHARFTRTAGGWAAAANSPAESLRKRPGLQGPIDDAFMDAFLVVKPTGRPMHEQTGNWAASECDHATAHWQKQFRGEARVKKDSELTDADLRDNNLVLFGDPSSNAVLAKIAAKLPLRWDSQTVGFGGETFPANAHVPVLIYPNPLNPNRYVVLNSGFTFREFDYLNNARQTPKLPDYAVIDTSVPVTRQAPGGIIEAGFFDEQWRVGK
jgi:hypothetical protein